MTRAEAEAVVKQIDRRCRGPFREEIHDEHVARMSPDLVRQLQKYPHANAREILNLLLEIEGTKPLAAELDDIMRTGCGHDFNTIVVAYPFDGKTREYECPFCHVTGVFTTPVFPDLVEE